MEVYDNIYTRSSGFAVALIALCAAEEDLTSQRADDLIAVFSKDNVETETFYRKWGVWPHVNTDILEQSLRSRNLNIDAIRSKKTKLSVGITHLDGSVEEVDAKRHPNPLALANDAMSAPFFSEDWNKKCYHDGFFQSPLPISKAIASGAKQVVVFLTEPIDLPPSQILMRKVMKVVSAPLPKAYTHPLGRLRSILRYPVELAKEIAFIKNPSLRPGVKILAFHPTHPMPIDSFSVDSKALKRVSDAATIYVRTLIKNVKQYNSTPADFPSTLYLFLLQLSPEILFSLLLRLTHSLTQS